MTDIYQTDSAGVDVAGWLKKRGKIFGKWSSYYCELHRTEFFIRKSDDETKIRHKYMITHDTKVTVLSGTKFPQMEIKIPNIKTMMLGANDYDTIAKWAMAIRSAAFQGSMLSADSFDLISVIGRGFFGKVLLVKMKKTQEYYALKTVKKEKLINSHQISTILSERDILARAKHTFVVNMQFAFQTASKFYIGMEYVPGGDLLGLMQREGKLTIDEVRLYAGEVALAIEHLHSIGVVFRDIKPENILIASDGHLKLADFGLSKDISATGTTTTFCGTAEFLAPEIVFNKPYSYAVDWWSFGILVYQMLYGKTPFFSESRASLLSKIKYLDPRFSNDPDPDVKDFICKFLDKNPDTRADYKSVENHPFWKGITREDLMNKKVSPSFVPVMRPSISTEYFDDVFTKEKAMDSFAEPMLGAENVFRGFSFMDETDEPHSSSSDISSAETITRVF